MLLWRSLKPSLIVAAAKALAARSAQGVAEPPRVTPLQPVPQPAVAAKER